jgi:hypothetical protein
MRVVCGLGTARKDVSTSLFETVAFVIRTIPFGVFCPSDLSYELQQRQFASCVHIWASLVELFAAVFDSCLNSKSYYNTRGHGLQDNSQQSGSHKAP